MKTLLVLCIILYSVLADQERDMNSEMDERGDCPYGGNPACHLQKAQQERNMNSMMTERGDDCPVSIPSCQLLKAHKARNSAMTERGLGQANFAEKEESK